MKHSTVTSKGQTTIPGEIRAALGIHPGDRLAYQVHGDHATVHVHPGTRALKGALASKKGKNMPFAQVRAAAVKAAMHHNVVGMGPALGAGRAGRGTRKAKGVVGEAQ